MTTVYENIHYDKNAMAKNLTENVLCYMHNNVRDLVSRLIPILKESTNFDNGTWLNHVKTYCDKSLCCEEFSYLSIPVMFDFHCKALCENGVMERIVGKHDEATSKELYKQQLLDKKRKLERLSEIVSMHDRSVKAVRESLQLLAELSARTVVQPKEHLRLDLYKEISLEYDIQRLQYPLTEMLKYFIIVPDDISDEDLFKLYNAHPKYHKISYTGYIHLHDKGEFHITNSSHYPFDYIVIIDTDVVDEYARRMMKYGCFAEPYESSWDERDLKNVFIRKHVTRYTRDESAYNDYTHYSTKQIIELALSTELDENKLTPEAQCMKEKLKQILDRGYAVMRFNSERKWIA